MADTSMLKTVNNVGSFTFNNANPILLPDIVKPSQKKRKKYYTVIGMIDA